MSRLAVLTIVCSLFLPITTPSAQAAPWKLNSPLASGQTIPGTILSPDGQTALYFVVDTGSQQMNMWSVPFFGGSPVKLNQDLTGSQKTQKMVFSGDSRYVFFTIIGSYPEHLYRTPANSSAPLRLTPAAPANTDCDITEILVDPQGTFVLYIADQEIDGKTGLYRTSSDGSAEPVLLSHPPASQANSVTKMALSPGRTWVVWRADASAFAKHELFSRTLDGSSGIITLNGAVNTKVENDFQISADGSTVIYRADQEAAGRYDLYSVPIGGGTPTRLFDGFVNPSGSVTGFKTAGTRVVFTADSLQAGVNEIYGVGLSGSSLVKLCPDQAGEPGVNSFQVLPDSSRVIYLAGQASPPALELYSVPLAGGAPLRINRNFPGEGMCAHFSLSPDGKLVAYLVISESSVLTVHTVAPDGSGPRRAAGLFPEGFMTQAMAVLSERQVFCWLTDVSASPPQNYIYLYMPQVNAAARLDQGLEDGVGSVGMSFDAKRERMAFIHGAELTNLNAYACLPPLGGGLPSMLLLK